MHVRQFESAQLLCLDSLYPPLSMRKECIQGLFVELKLVARSDSDRDLLSFFLCIQNNGCSYCQRTVTISLEHIEPLGQIEKRLLQLNALQVSAKFPLFFRALFLFFKVFFHVFLSIAIALVQYSSIHSLYLLKSIYDQWKGWCFSQHALGKRQENSVNRELIEFLVYLKIFALLEESGAQQDQSRKELTAILCHSLALSLAQQHTRWAHILRTATATFNRRY